MKTMVLAFDVKHLVELQVLEKVRLSTKIELQLNCTRKLNM